MTMYGIEMQLMKEWQPRSRPTHGFVSVGEPDARPEFTRLIPGAAAQGYEEMIVVLSKASRVDKLWARMDVFLQIEGTGFPGPRPGLVFLGPSQIWTGVVHFPRMALDGNPMFGGWHSLVYRITAEVGK